MDGEPGPGACARGHPRTQVAERMTALLPSGWFTRTCEPLRGGQRTTALETNHALPDGSRALLAAQQARQRRGERGYGGHTGTKSNPQHEVGLRGWVSQRV